MKFGGLGKLKDDDYVFTLQIGYGVECRAASEVFTVLDGKVVSVKEGALVSDAPALKKANRAINASLGMLKVRDRSLHSTSASFTYAGGHFSQCSR